MNYYKKNVRYLKFYEDVKLIQNDEHNDRLAIVFYGKERLIHIFESTSYTNYMPIKICDQTEKRVDTDSNNNAPAPMEINFPKKNTVDIRQLFLDIRKNQKQQAPQLIEEDNQQYIIYNNFQKNEKTAEKPFEVTKFDMFFKAELNPFNIELSFLKPKIKTKLLSVIQTYNIHGIEWFSFHKDTPLLLVINFENSISVYKIRVVDHGKKTLINWNELQGQPFRNFPEQWNLFGNATQNIPIKDYYLKKSSGNVFKLYTVHVDNSIYFWFILMQNTILKITPTFSVTLDYDFAIENILINSNETFLYCFNNNGIQIYKLSDLPPFKLVYIHSYDYMTPKSKNKGNEIVSSSCSSELDEELIDINEHVKNEEDKFFKSLQKPFFSIVENVLFIQLYHNNEDKYSLLYFNTEGLMKIFEDISFFEKCIKGTERTLIKTFYESDTNFSFCLSPSLYLKNNKITSIESNINSNEILDSLQQILLISLEKNNIFIQIPTTIPIETKLRSFPAIDSFKISEGSSKNYKSIVTWLKKNTIIITSLKQLFTVVKYCNEIDIFGYPVSYEKIQHFFQ